MNWKALTLVAALSAVPSVSHSLSFDVTYDLTAIAGQTFAFGFFWTEAGNPVNTLTVSNIDWGEGGGAVGDPLKFGQAQGNLTDGLHFHEHGWFWQQFTPSATEPLTFHLDITEVIEPFTFWSDDIWFTIASAEFWPNFLCSDCSAFLRLGHPLTLPHFGESEWYGLGQVSWAPTEQAILLAPPALSNVTAPEPSTMILLASGLVLLGWRYRKGHTQ